MNKGCKHRRPILVHGFLTEIEPDQEPYKAGELEKIETICCHASLTGHYCAGCGTLLDISVEDT